MVDEQGNQRANVVTEQSIRGRLPGPRDITVEYRIPDGAGLRQGTTYHLEMGLVFHKAVDRLMPIAIREGKTSDGWYRLSTVTLAP